MRGARLLCTVLLALAGASCREADGPAGPGSGGARMLVTSEPAGAAIFIDQRDTGLRTPDTVGGLAGTHALALRLDTAGLTYSYNAQVTLARSDSIPTVHAPLTVQCGVNGTSACFIPLSRQHEAANVRFSTSALGSLFFRDGSGQGAFWPRTSINSYMSGSMPVFAAVGTGATRVALGVYDNSYLAGRPAPTVTASGTAFELRQTTWVVPPTAAHQRLTTARGIEVTQSVVASETLEGVLIIQLSFRNITALPAYRFMDAVPAAGITYTDMYVGLALDPDIGESRDDLLSYDPALDMVFAYDARFTEPLFTAGAAAAPGLVGLRALSVPAGADVILSGWVSQPGSVNTGDWSAGTLSEASGYGVLSGRTPHQPAHPDPRIGHMPQFEGDVRIAVTAGPLTLQPGEETTIVLAFAIAPPVDGSYQPGLVVPPGDPFDTSRELYAVAGRLRQLMQGAAAFQAGR